MKARPCRFFLYLLLVLFSLGGVLGAQELAAEPAAAVSPEDEAGAEDAGEAPVEEIPELSPEQKILDMDIRTSTLSELAAWCRSLGLSEGGTREELVGRLRAHFEIVPPPSGAGAGKERLIIIESARSTEYFTLDVVDEDYARLRGDVVVSLKDGDATHRITAWDILYNRTRNIMTATGGVEYIKTEGETTETFRGDSITVNLDTWASVFTGGVSEKSLSTDETTYRFAGTIISRSDEEVTVMTKATINNAKNEEALWTLNASRLWLMPGSDWAILNAVLKVGEIPLLYIPFFYYPADELIFHPVLGFRSREGNFVQTTTYILGRPKASSASENSITKIMGSGADPERRREGIFLRSTGKKAVDPNDTRLSVIFDAYANLGTYLGTELALPKKGPFGAFDLSAGVGWTRDVVRTDTGYTPFPRYDGTSDWHRSQLFSYDAPFRFRLNTKGSVAGKYGSLSLSLPFYSDPYTDRDFLNRSENMDWLGMLREGAQKQEEELTTTTADKSLSSYEWRLSGSFNPSVSSLAPYISGFSVSSFTSTVSFRSRPSARYNQLTPQEKTNNFYSPTKNFFFPDKFTMYSLSLSITGTPLTLGGSSSQTTQVKPVETEDPLSKIGTPRSPFELAETSPATPGVAGAAQLTPPSLSQRFEPPRAGGPRFSIDYRLNPTSASELQFNSAQGSSTHPHWMEQEDIDWGDISTILTTFRNDGSTGFTLAHSEGGLYTLSFRFSGTGSWQEYTYINEEAQEFLDYSTGKPDQNRINDVRRRAYAATYFTSSWEHSTIIKPLYRSTVWGNSSLQYTLKGLLFSNNFDTTSTALDPLWKKEYGAWEKEKIDTHQAGATLAASVMDKVQDLTVTAELPPKDSNLTGNATVRAWISETNARGKILFPWEPEDRKIDPLYFTETLRWSPRGSFQQNVVYDPELEEFTSVTSNLSWSGFTASLSAVRTRNYDFDSAQGGWIQSQEPEKLNFRDLRFAYAGTFRQDSVWGKRLSFSFNFNTGLNFDLQRYTYSRFNFSLGFTLGIAGFVDMTFSATSENAVVYRYFQNMPLFTVPVDTPVGETNLFIDLLNSFRFDDDILRKSSGFKLKTFKLDLTHHLGDWNAKLGLAISPYLDQTSEPYSYKLNNEVSFIVQWIPISEIKTELEYKKEKLTYK